MPTNSSGVEGVAHTEGDKWPPTLLRREVVFNLAVGGQPGEGATPGHLFCQVMNSRPKRSSSSTTHLDGSLKAERAGWVQTPALAACSPIDFISRRSNSAESEKMAACTDTPLQDRWLMGQFVVVTPKVGVTLVLHEPAKVTLAACSGTDDAVAARPARTSCG